MKDPKWKQFEKAVATFISALEPTAQITHDAILPDIDTGKPRQRDVWIETKVCHHFQLKILVSCKRYKSKLNQQHLDAFIGELRSSGAQKGVIYSYSGFTKPALKKADIRGISCCRLYQNEPPDLPESLLFNAFLLTPAIHLKAFRLQKAEGQPETINDLLDLQLPDSAKFTQMTLLDFIEEKYYEQRQEVRNTARETGELPTKWTDTLTIKDPNTGTELLLIDFGGDWDFYEAMLEGNLLNGSYSFTEKEFKGEQLFPNIANRGPNPGKCWRKIEEIPKALDKTSLIGVLYGGKSNYREGMRSFGKMPIPEI